MNWKILVVATTLAAIGNAETGAELFQKALVKERAAGNLEEAIQIYQRVAKDFASDRALAARALVQAARCYEKLGQNKATSLYEEVTRKYPDQREQAAIARQRLAIMVTPAKPTEPEVMAFRPIPLPESACAAFYQPTRLYYLPCNGPDLIASSFDGTGEVAILKRRPGVTGGMPVRFSPDGKQFAVASIDEGKTFLAVANSDGSGSLRKLPRQFDQVYPYEWSPDGRSLITTIDGDDQHRWLATLSIADGSARKLVDLGLSGVAVGQLSPDGKYVAWTRSDEGSSTIYIAAGDGSNAGKLSEHSSHHRVVGWSPDGRHVLFISDRDGSAALYALSVTAGHSDGNPRKLIGLVNTMGMIQNTVVTRDGTFAYSTSGTRTQPRGIRLDSATGRFSGEPYSISGRFEQETSFLGWSRDGRYSAFIGKRTRQLGSGQEPVLTIRDEQSGRDHDILLRGWEGLRGPTMFHGAWSRSGAKIYLAANRGVVEVDISTGALKKVYDRARQPGAMSVQEHPDGKSVVVAIGGTSLERSSVIRVDVVTGQTAELAAKEGANYVMLSPDGSRAAALEQRGDQQVLSVRPVSSGEWKDIQTLTAGHYSALDWTEDGKFLQYRCRTGDPESVSMWRVSPEGGQPEKLGEMSGSDASTLRQFQVHPSGTKAVYMDYHRATELWTLRNYLPKNDAAATVRGR